MARQPEKENLWFPSDREFLRAMKRKLERAKRGREKLLRKIKKAIKDYGKNPKSRL